MKSRYIAIIATGLLVTLNMAHADTIENERAAHKLGAKTSSMISFAEGSATLTDKSKSEIRELVKKAEAHGKIEEVKVAAWADRDYVAEDTKASKSEIDLAKRRINEVEKYLKSDLKVDDVDAYNMSERPNSLEKFLNTDTEKTKTAMEDSGAAPKKTTETGMFGQKSKASKAVLMVIME